MSGLFTSNATSSAAVFSLELHPRFNTGNVRRVVQEPADIWRQSAVQQLNDLVALERGWDGYGAGPVRFDTAYFALRMLDAACVEDTPAPQIVPGSDGDLQIEWHLPGGDIELHVRAPLQVSAWARVNGAEEAVELTNDFSLPALWLPQIAGQQLAAAAAA